MATYPKRVVPFATYKKWNRVTQNSYTRICIGYMVNLDVYETDDFLAPFRDHGELGTTESKEAMALCHELRTHVNRIKSTSNLF